MSEDNENVVIEMKPSTDEAAKASVSIDIKDKSEEITPSTAVKKENGVAKQDEEKKDDAKQTATANGDDEKEKNKEEIKEKDDDKAKPAASMADPPKPVFRFWKLLWELHATIITLNGYYAFLFKWILLQLIRVSGAFAFLVFAAIVKDDLDLQNITSEQFVAFAAIGILNVASQLLPHATMYLIDGLKMQLQISQATSVVAKIFKLEHNAMISTPTGEFSQLLRKVYMNVDRLLPGLYGQCLPMAAETFVATILVAALYGWIGLIQLILFLACTVVAYRSAGRKAQRNEEMMTTMFKEWASLLATVSSYEIAHFFDNVEFEVKKSRSSFEYMGQKILKFTQGEHKDKAVGTGVSLTLLAFWLTVLLPIVAGEVSSLEFIALALYYLIFISNLGAAYALGVSELRSALQESMTLTEFVERRSGIDDIPNALELKRSPNPDIEFKGVTFAYKDKVILDKISFKINGGETLGLVGSSGCGKSTIVRLLMRFYKHTEGTILVDGHDITKVSAYTLRNLFSVVPQMGQLFNKTIRENIKYGRMSASEDDILKAAELAELKFDNDFTLDKVCGEKGAKLSGGQQQRVSLARAMLKNGTIYLLDEPTTGLDGIVAKALQKTLDALTSNATTIMVTHHLDHLRHASQIIYLDKGKIVERGTYDELLALKGVFYRQTRARIRSPTIGSESEAKTDK